jgi:hypothetical protein
MRYDTAMQRRALRGLVLVLAGVAACTSDDGENDGSSSEGTEDGDTTGDPDAPTLVSGEFVDDTTIRLVFSEPMAAPDGVEPSDFRLSIAAYYPDPDYGGRTYYEDPMLWLCSRTDACFDDYTEVVGVRSDEMDENALLLDLDIFSPYICPIVNSGIEMGIPNAVLPHYRQGDDATVQDVDGDSFSNLGADWVDEEQLGTVALGEYPDYPTLVAIPCDLEP